jgi:hypothetical protein
MKKLIPTCLAIVVLGGLEAFALSRGIDGALFSAVTLIIGGLAGYETKRLKDTK